jgi:hypothetical protein
MRKLKEFKQLWSGLNDSSSMSGSNILQEISAAIYRSSFNPNQRVESPTITPNSFNPNQRVESPTITPPGSGTTLGYEAFVCERCLHIALRKVMDSAPRRSERLNHVCNKEIARGSRTKEDFSKELMTRKQFLIDCLAAIVITTSQFQEKFKIIAVEVPGFGFGLNEELIDLDPVKRDIPSWVYDVAKMGETILDKVGLQEYIEMFGSTFAFFCLTIYEKPKFYFVYISNGLQAQHLKYIKMLFEPRKRTDFYCTSKDPNRPQSTKLQDMISFVRIGKNTIPLFRLSPMQFYQTCVLKQYQAA